MKTLYLERHIPTKALHHYWSGWVQACLAHIQIGVIKDGEIDHRRTIEKQFNSDGEAVEALIAVYRNKRSGYFYPVNPPFLKEDDKNKVEISVDNSDSGQYSIYWDTKEKFIDAESILKAYDTLSEFLFKLEFHNIKIELDLIGYQNTPYVKISEDDKVFVFGFIPQAFYDGLGGRDQKAISRGDHTIANGFLTPAGNGRGIFTTNGRIVDLAIKVFLKALSNSTSVEVSCDYNLNWQKPFTLGARSNSFMWNDIDVNNILADLSLGVRHEPILTCNNRSRRREIVKLLF